jgi:hypothetical protein
MLEGGKQMSKRVRIFILGLMIMIGGLFLFSCDLGINNLPDGFLDQYPMGFDIKKMFDPKVSYNQVLSDLEYMKTKCYSNKDLAGAQAYTILMSYGLADMSKEVTSYTDEQLSVKALLFEKIKMIYIQSNNEFAIFLSFEPQTIYNLTVEAIDYCKIIISYL